MLSNTTIKVPLPNTWHSVNFYNALTHQDSFLLQCIPTFQILTLRNINSQLPTLPSSQIDKGLKKHDGPIYNFV